MLQVRFAEVNRARLKELGVSFFTSRDRHQQTVIGRTTTQQFAAPDFDKLEYTKAEPGSTDVTSVFACNSRSATS